MKEAGLFNSFGLFETMRSYNGRIVYFEQHLKRLKNSCHPAGLNFTYSIQRLKKSISDIVRRHGLKDACIKFCVYRSDCGQDAFILVKEYRPYDQKKYEQGMSLAVSSFRQNESSLLARIKTTDRMLYELSFNQAKRRGFDGSLILNNRGFIAEASRSNIFFVQDDTLFTPQLSCGCLDGITRRAVLDLAKKYNINFCEGKFTPADLYRSDEAFLTNSLAGIMPIAQVEGNVIGKDKCRKLYQFLSKKYDCLLK